LALLLLAVLIGWAAGTRAQEEPSDPAAVSEATFEPTAETADIAPPVEEVAEQAMQVEEEAPLPQPPHPTPVPASSDWLSVVVAGPSLPLDEGGATELRFDYGVTSSRASTTFVAEIGGSSGQNGAWTVQLQAGGIWSEAGSRVVLSDAQYTGDGSTIPLSVIVTAPQDVVVDETITIWLSSSVLRLDGGVEQGIVATQPVSSVSVAPPTPTSTPNLAPTESPVIDPVLTCAGPAEYEVQIGGEVHITCEVTILDSRAGAVVAIEPPSGWTVASGDGVASTAPLEVGPFALDDDVATVHAIPITVQARAAAGEEGALTIRLLQESEARTELDSATISLTTFIPADWELTCSAGSTNAVPGGSVDISCELPEAAWALRGDAPAYSHAVDGGTDKATLGPLDAASFSLSVNVPCSVPAEHLPIDIVAALSSDLRLADTVLLPIARIAPTVTIEEFSIMPVAFSLESRVTPGTMTIHVESAAPQCEEWMVLVSVQTCGGTQPETPASLTSVGNLIGAPSSGYRGVDSERGASLGSPVMVSIVGYGAEPGVYTQTIGFELTLPGQLSAGAYNAQASVTIAPVIP
jgi:hypothetical protein